MCFDNTVVIKMFIRIEIRKLILLTLICIINIGLIIGAQKNNCFHLCYGVIQCIADCEDMLEFEGTVRPAPTRKPTKAALNFIGDVSDKAKKKPNKNVKSMSQGLQDLPEHCGLRHISNSQPARGAGLYGMGRIVGGKSLFCDGKGRGQRRVFMGYKRPQTPLVLRLWTSTEYVDRYVFSDTPPHPSLIKSCHYRSLLYILSSNFNNLV